MAASPAAHQQQQQQPIVHETKGLGRLPPRTEQYSTRSKQVLDPQARVSDCRSLASENTHPPGHGPNVMGCGGWMIGGVRRQQARRPGWAMTRLLDVRWYCETGCLGCLAPGGTLCACVYVTDDEQWAEGGKGRVGANIEFPFGGL